MRVVSFLGGCFFLFSLQLIAISSSENITEVYKEKQQVNVFYHISKQWGGHDMVENQQCEDTDCRWYYDEHINKLQNKFDISVSNITSNNDNSINNNSPNNDSTNNINSNSNSNSSSSSFSYSNISNNPITTVAVYNVHLLLQAHVSKIPLNCLWRTNLTMATSEEAHIRYHHLFDKTFPNFDGNSTNSPNSTVQRIYSTAYLPKSGFLEGHNFTYLIKAGTYGK